MTVSRSSETPSSTSRLPQRLCSHCGLNRPEDRFYFADKAKARRRGQCIDCVRDLKRARRDDPDWRPSCSRCGEIAPRPGKGGRRLCVACHDAIYGEARNNGSHRLRLKPCWGCGGPKEYGERAHYCNTCRAQRLGQTKGMRRFGLFPSDYAKLLAAQGGGCAICGGEQRGGKLYAIDHDHLLGEARAAVRGLLCDICNYQRLSLFRDDAGMLRRAADYLDHPPAAAVLA